MDKATLKVADYIHNMGIKVAVVAKETGISDGILRRSLCMKERALRADEFLKICQFLKTQPDRFYEARQPITPAPPG